MASGTTHRPTHEQQNKSNQASPEAQPRLHQRGRIIQQPNTIRQMPLGLSPQVRLQCAQSLNQVLADTLMLYHLYKKAHWQVAGSTFYQLHLLYDKHAEEQLELVDLIAERVQSLGGVALGMPSDIVQSTRIEQPPQGAEEVPVVIDRLLEAHERILIQARDFAKKADEAGDNGTNDLLVSNVIRTNELQVWFIAEHVVDTPTTQARDGAR
jgi:starvation-inducible DNA-binding protein